MSDLASRRWALEKRMAAKTVNLDALIPRDDFISEATKAGGQPRTTISVSDLDKNGFFQNSLRKPDFQRETTHWAPATVVDLIRAFLDRDLIPAVILWERGEEVFVIDGAHRLSALIAWIRDDYGDGTASNAVFGSGLTDEQRRVAEQTRKLVKKELGTYAEFSGLLGQEIADPIKAKRLSAIGKNSLQIQWVTAATAEAAETSFFKINQAAVPIDPIERRLLQNRNAPNAIASRCIVRGGGGHKYWSGFSDENKDKIEKLGAELYTILYKPPHSSPTKSPDQPIAGQGYNALPFVYFLVSLCNGIPIPTNLNNKKIEDALENDTTGTNTIEYLQNVKRKLQKITTNHAGSLGLHPLIYYYSASGNFYPNALYASIRFADRLEASGQKNAFSSVRRKFEEYLLANKLFVSLTVTRLGSGARSLNRIADLYWRIFVGMRDGKTDQQLFEAFVTSEDFVHLKQSEIPPPSAGEPRSRRGASTSSKSAAFIREAMASPIRCAICEGAIHSNSMTMDHLERKQDGGDNQSKNLAPAHPYCNSGYKN